MLVTPTETASTETRVIGVCHLEQHSQGQRSLRNQEKERTIDAAKGTIIGGFDCYVKSREKMDLFVI